MYALNVADDGRILSITFEKYAAEGMPIVDSMPEGDYNDYRYVEGEYVLDPLPKPEPMPEQPTELERLRADTDFLLAMGGFV